MKKVNSFQFVEIPGWQFFFCFLLLFKHSKTNIISGIRYFDIYFGLPGVNKIIYQDNNNSNSLRG